MSHYHLFLPPTDLPQLGHGTAIPRLQFEELHVPPEVASQFSWTPTPSQRFGLDSTSNCDRKPHIGPSGTGGTPISLAKRVHPTDIGDLAGGEGIRSRGTSIKRSRTALRGSGTMSASLGSEAIASGSRRRSARLDKSVSGLLGTFPNIGLDTTYLGANTTAGNDESFMSLNTTVSNPSQLPSTADQSSVLNLPRWSIPLSKLTSLTTLLSLPPSHSSTTAISTIVCVLSVDQPVLRMRKEEKARGRDGTLWIGNWNVTCPPEKKGEDAVGGCAVKLWDNAARDWGDERVRKGDVVLLENVSFKSASTARPSRSAGITTKIVDDQPQISISDQSRPKITILYRTLPRYFTPGNDYVFRPGPNNYDGMRGESEGKVVPEDKLLRPDLRLGRSDLGVRQVAEVVSWFAGFVGGHAPS